MVPLKLTVNLKLKTLFYQNTFNCSILKNQWLSFRNIIVCRDISQLSSADEERLHGSLDST